MRKSLFRTGIRLDMVLVFAMMCPAGQLSALDAQAIVKDSFDYWRGQTSVSIVDMTIHRPNWERVVTIKAWTKGEEDSLFRIIAPAKDKDNGTLKKGKNMWMYNPKINRVIKIPPSMMSQSWLGSDFSNNDLSKTDSLLHEYTHGIIGTETHDGQTVYIIQSIPKPAAPVVWGMQKLKIREDHIFLEQAFFDENRQPVRVMSAHAIQMLGNRLFPKKWKMQKVDVTDEYTLLEYRELSFNEELPDGLFTLSNLRNPRR